MVACHRCSGFAASLLDPFQPVGLTATTSTTQSLTFPSDIDLRDTDTAPWSATINGSSVAVSSVSVGSSTVLDVTLASAPSGGDTVEVQYNPAPYTVHADNDGATTNAFTQSATATV